MIKITVKTWKPGSKLQIVMFTYFVDRYPQIKDKFIDDCKLIFGDDFKLTDYQFEIDICDKNE